MRDGATGRSRGFGFLTFKDPKTVNVVMVKEHYLDGKIVGIFFPSMFSGLITKEEKTNQTVTTQIDPKRAIPRDEQEKTSKIFVGGVSQETTDAEFKDYFAQFGRVVDATLMMDKDTGRPRGFGFVTFESEAGVDACLSADLAIHGKPIEVKKAQPRGNMREEEEANRRGGKFGRGKGAIGNNNNNNMEENTNMSGSGMGAGAGGMTPQAMARQMQQMQQMFAMWQQQMAMNRGMAGGMGMNPQAAMMQMMQMQQMQQQMMMNAQQQGGAGRGNGSPNSMAGGNMNPAMMQQMMNQMASQTQQQGGQANMQGGANQNRPAYNAFEQQVFEQQKYEQRRRDNYGSPQQGYGMGGGGGGAPTSWEGMYDDVPQPNVNQGGMGGSVGMGGAGAGAGGGGGGRGGFRNRGGFHNQQPHQQSPGPVDPNKAPPANAPTGPKNAGKPGANYRGGGRGGGARGFHPYGR